MYGGFALLDHSLLLEADGDFQPRILKICFATKDHNLSVAVATCLFLFFPLTVSHKKAEMLEMSTPQG